MGVDSDGLRGFWFVTKPSPVPMGLTGTEAQACQWNAAALRGAA